MELPAATKEGTGANKPQAWRKAEAGGEPFGGGKNWKELARTGLEIRTWKKKPEIRTGEPDLARRAPVGRRIASRIPPGRVV